MVNHWYFYGFDADFGAFYIKFCGYFPYTGQIYLNGHEYAKRQCLKAGIGFNVQAGPVLLDGRDVSYAIRAPEVSEAASRVAADPGVREALVVKQRELIARGDRYGRRAGRRAEDLPDGRPARAGS